MLDQLGLNMTNYAAIGKRFLGIGFLAIAFSGCNGDGYEGPVLKGITPEISEVMDSETVTFSALVREVPGTTFQWYQGVPEGIVNIPGERKQSYTVTFKYGDKIDYIGVAVRAPNESSEAGNTRQLTIKAKPVTFAKPLPSSELVSRGNGLTQSAELNYATAPITYQWNKNAQPIAGQTTAVLILPSLTAADNGSQITLTTTNPAGSFTSNVMTLIVQ